jgi:hypothetical protein
MHRCSLSFQIASTDDDSEKLSGYLEEGEASTLMLLLSPLTAATSRGP